MSEQVFHVYSDYVDAANWERLRLEFDGEKWSVVSEAAGTGIIRPVRQQGEPKETTYGYIDTRRVE